MLCLFPHKDNANGMSLLPFYDFRGIRQYKNNNTPIIDNLLYRGDGVILAGQSEAGKSLLCLQLACSLASGKELFAGLVPESKHNVLYIPTEGSLGTVKARLEKFGTMYGIEETSPHLRVMSLLGKQFNTEPGYLGLTETLLEKGYKPDVIMIDSLYLSCKGGLNSDEIAADYCRHLNELIEKYNCAIILVHHYAKAFQSSLEGKIERDAKDVKGSTAWGDWATSILRLSNRRGKKVLTIGKDRNDSLYEGEINLELVSNEEELRFKEVQD